MTAEISKTRLQLMILWLPMKRLKITRMWKRSRIKVICSRFYLRWNQITLCFMIKMKELLSLF